LGLEQAHVIASVPGEVLNYANTHPKFVTSLTLVCPARIDADTLGSFNVPRLVMAGDQGPPGEIAKRAASGLADTSFLSLRDYFSPPWADAVADCAAEIIPALLSFLGSVDQPCNKADQSIGLAEGEGEVADISYRIQGSGFPVVLFPLGLASSQWEPLLTVLSERYCTITLGGTELGFMATLESRGSSSGYLDLIRHMVTEAQLQPGEHVLDVGCGSGIVDRWLARYTGKANPITGVDINRYLLGEAEKLAKREELEDVLTFQEGNAESLPFPDNSFDVTTSHTALEESDAELMLSEMVRVTKSGGRVIVIVRAMDVPWVVNVPVNPELKAKVEIPRGFASPQGCADASLYGRLLEAGLTQVRMYPQLATFDQPQTPIGKFWQAAILGALTSEETQEWQTAVAQAEEEGTFFIAQSHHCAVGVKPG